MRHRISEKLERGKRKPRAHWRHERLECMAYHWLLKVAGCDRVFVEPWVQPPFMEHPDVVGYKHKVCYVIECKTKTPGQWVSAERAKWLARPYSLGEYRWFCGPPEAVLKAETKSEHWKDHGILLDIDDQLSEFRPATRRNATVWTGSKGLFALPAHPIAQRYWPNRQEIKGHIERCRNLHFEGPGKKPPQSWYRSLPSIVVPSI